MFTGEIVNKRSFAWYIHSIFTSNSTQYVAHDCAFL
ncbi:unnamed protein product [Schistosoma mattheei]|uniref:Uncharacterized protein n=1 Tax=Schistosoma mattheei TaxID=31246 RepID=A0A183NG62_9TREM|nr:unnamed protein product [Schistosoma mattheei]